MVWNGLSIYFFGDEFAGWVYRGPAPRLATLEGVTIGSPFADLGASAGDVNVSTTNLGIEMEITTPTGRLRGFLTDDGSHVASLNGGVRCVFN